jgi:hypothetical protein
MYAPYWIIFKTFGLFFSFSGRILYLNEQVGRGQVPLRSAVSRGAEVEEIDKRKVIIREMNVRDDL